MIEHTVALAPGADIDGFRRALRRLLANGADPAHVSWNVGEPALLAGEYAEGLNAPPTSLPRAVIDLVGIVVRHCDPERYALLHRLARRMQNGERRLLEVASDPLVHGLEHMRKAVARDIHKLHAFVRFRRVEDADGEKLVAWFEPDHHILEAAALPAALNSHGTPRTKGPRDWQNTFVAKSKAGNLIIFQKRGSQIMPLYVLKTSVTIKPRLGMKKTLDAGLPYFVDRAMDAMVRDIAAAK